MYRLQNGCILWDDGVLTNSDNSGPCTAKTLQVTQHEELRDYIQHGNSVLLIHTWAIIALQALLVLLLTADILASLLWRRRKS